MDFVRYLRLRLFYYFLKPFSAYNRQRRMKRFTRLLETLSRRNLYTHQRLRILDLGGKPDTWTQITQPLDITILNLPGENDAEAQQYESHHRLTFIDGDACRVSEFKSNSFDLIFSNSVIEHVGDRQQQEAFAHEVHRLGQAYWVQTPSKYFPIEAHCGMPLWWFYPVAWRRYFIRRWRGQRLYSWADMVEGTRVLDRKTLTRLFPDSLIEVERFLGWPKSYILYKMAHTSCVPNVRANSLEVSIVDS